MLRNIYTKYFLDYRILINSDNKQYNNKLLIYVLLFDIIAIRIDAFVARHFCMSSFKSIMPSNWSLSQVLALLISSSLL